MHVNKVYLTNIVRIKRPTFRVLILWTVIRNKGCEQIFISARPMITGF